MALTIWLYAIFSNEAELLPFFLRHYATACDRLILYDNGSTDNSLDLIRACSKAEVRRYPSDHAVMDSIDAVQFAASTYQEARGQADYALWVDCDEFLWSGSIPLRELLRDYRHMGIRAVKSCGYQMLSGSFPVGDAPLTEQVRYGIRDTEYDKVAIFDPHLDLSWKPGRHSCRIDGNIVAHQGEVQLLHYRFLGVEYWQRRNAYNYANRSATEIEAGRSYHVAPNHQGKYSLTWYQNAMNYMSDVVTQTWIGV